jgi:hypothetical protein
LEVADSRYVELVGAGGFSAAAGAVHAHHLALAHPSQQRGEVKLVSLAE